MKNLLLKPRLEVIFTLSLVAILGLPPLVLAQDQKSIEIRIVNGDTTVNGKNVKQMTAAERKEALGEIDKVGNLTFKHTGKDGQSDIVIRRNRLMRKPGKPGDLTAERRMFGNDDNASSPYRIEFDNDGDSIRNTVRFKIRRLRGADSARAFEFNGVPLPFDEDKVFSFNERRPVGPRFRMRLDRPGMGRFDDRNVQTFNYSTTDNDGISTDVSFRVSDARGKRGEEPSKNTMNLSDLTLSPEFSTGKILISFNLPAKIAAYVKLTDSDGKVILAEKATAGSFVKKVSMPRNGVYTLTVKQGANTAVKRIVKED